MLIAYSSLVVSVFFFPPATLKVAGPTPTSSLEGPWAMSRGDHLKGAAKSNKYHSRYIDDAAQRITDLSEQLAAEKQVSAELFSFILINP